MLRFRLPALSCLVCTGLFATIGAQADSWGNQGYGNPGYGNPVYGSGGYGSATTPYPRGFSDVGEGGWINSNEPQFRPLDPPASSRSSGPSQYRPLDTPPARPTYSTPSYGYPSAPYGGSYGGSYSAPAYPGGGYADPNQRDRGYPNPGYRDQAYRDTGHPSASDRYAPSGRYPDAYTPPPVIDWSSSLPKPRVDMEDFPFNHGIGEGLGTNARDYGADPRLPYDLPYRSRSLPRDDTPRRDAGNPAPARSMMDDLRGQPGGREAPIAPATDGANRYDYPIPPAPPRDLLPSPRASAPEPVWTPPGHDQFRPLTADERQEWDQNGGDRNRRGDSAPSYYMPPMDEYGEQLRESARAFERRIGEPVPPSPRPTIDAPAESLPSAMPPSSPLSAPIFISPITEPASSKPGEAVPRPSPIDTTPSLAPAMPPTTPPNPAPETRLPTPPVDAGAAKPVDEQFRPLEEEPSQPGGQAIENDLPPRVESSAETG